MRGSTDSDDDVPSTISSSSLMYLMNFQIEKPWTRAMRAENHEDEDQAGGVEGTPSAARASSSEPTPYLPIVKAIAPKAPIGATFMM